MIYVISKTTCGEYNVRDIQCNANWDCCPYSDYARIPDSMVEDILATCGYCDITLNEDETEVVSFVAREIPPVPEEIPPTVLGRYPNPSTGTLFVLGNGTPDASSNAFEVLEDGTVFINNTDYVNPPMLEHEEYRTAERYKNLPVYRKVVDLGDIAKGESTHFLSLSGLSNAVEVRLINQHEDVTHWEGITNLTFGIKGGPDEQQAYISLKTTGGMGSVQVILKYTK